jgi:hypothetical protein
LLDELETLQEELFNLKRLIETSPTVDDDQMLWLQEGLIASHRDPTVRGRILTLHHPPYVTEKTKYNQADTMAIRRRLRQVLDAVAAKLGREDRATGAGEFGGERSRPLHGGSTNP